MKYYTYPEVEAMQQIEVESGVVIGGYEGSLFKLVDIPVKSIPRQGESLASCIKHGWDGDVKTIEHLMQKIKEGTKLTPIVVTEHNDLMDGWHRLIAYKELKYKIIQVFQRVGSEEHWKLMNKQALRIASEILAEIIKYASYDYSSVQVNLPEDVSKKFKAFQSKLPKEILYNDEDGNKGLEDKSHVTVKYGLHTADPDEVEEIINGTKAFEVELGKTAQFECDENDVLIVEVKSNELAKLNKLISDKLECTDTHPEYIPHATIAYLKKGEAKGFIDDATFEGIKCTIDKICFSPKEDATGKTPKDTFFNLEE